MFLLKDFRTLKVPNQLAFVVYSIFSDMRDCYTGRNCFKHLEITDSIAITT